MIELIKSIFGSKSQKDVKEIMPIVEEINSYYAEFDSLTDEELKEKSNEFRSIIKANSQELEDEKQALHDRLATEDLDFGQIQDIYERINSLEKELFQNINDTLNELLPQAFACVKQACKRLKEQEYTYEYAGHRSKWEMIPYDVQLVGGIVQHQGKISEMATGEGKTLVAVLPIYLNALAGKGVHLVTVNDYLASRDADWMRPVYEFLGVSVGAIQSNMENADRKRMYNLDITYGTNNEFGFDYLRDNMVGDMTHKVQREHWFAIVDEVDSVLIDEARTPLIISGPVGQVDQKFEEMNPRVRRLVDAQNKLVNQVIADNMENLDSEDKEKKDAAGMALLMGHRGFPKNKRLLKLMQEPKYQKLLRDTELFYLRDQGRAMHQIDEKLFYTIDEKNHQVDIMEKGRELLATAQEDPEMFLIPDIAGELSQLEVDTSITPEEKQKRVDELHLVYAERSDRIHTVTQLLRAYSLYERDVEYVIQDGKVMIVDEFTGRILEGRRYSEGLHQAIEAKENVKVERDTQTLATITLQNYFRLYHKLAGMTGTAETEAGEFDKIYNLDVVVIPTNRPIVRDDKNDLIFKTKREKYNAIGDEVQNLLKAGRAVLVGTASVEVSEVLSKLLTRKGIKHSVLNAKHHEREAEIVANAGKRGAVTIATNMAGRGTDIKLDPDVKQSGGLAIVGSERHEARRIDRQLRGRSGRQGDPGSSRFYISLEDDLMRLFGGERIASVMQRLKIPEGEPIEHSMITKSVERAQKKVEENNFSIRKRLLEYDDVMNQQRTVIYTRRNHALKGDRMKGEIFEYLEEMTGDWYAQYHPENDLDGLKNQLRSNILTEFKVTQEEFQRMNPKQFQEMVMDGAKEFYRRKEEMLGVEFMSRLERVAALQTIDDKWREHLRAMDDLKEGINLRSYGQKDPLLEYKKEAYNLFVELLRAVNKETVNFAFKYFPRMVEREVRGPAPKEAQVGEDGLPKVKRMASGNVQYQKSDTPNPYTSSKETTYAGAGEGQATTVRTFRREDVKVGRNDPCPCGSGKKYKNCHGRV